jgi:hypothetical protein
VKRVLRVPTVMVGVLDVLDVLDFEVRFVIAWPRG